MKNKPEETYSQYLHSFYFEWLYLKRFQLSVLTIAELWVLMPEGFDYDCLFNIPVNEN